MLTCVTIKKNAGANRMEHIHHEWQDTANFSSNEYLVVNSCGFQNSLPLYTVLRHRDKGFFGFIRGGRQS